MCGRFTLRTPTERWARQFALEELPLFAPRYNMAPTQRLPVVRLSANGTRACDELRWGFIPSWSAGEKHRAPLINARAESIAEKPSFRDAVHFRRCLIPADGFYEWEQDGRQRQPYFVSRRDDRPFAFAGLWESWRPPEGGPAIETFVIVTTEANALLSRFHDGRMPVMLQGDHGERWLFEESRHAEDLIPLLGAYPEEELTCVRVSARVNSVRHDDPSCLEAPLRTQTLFD
ncbi:Putative SOS response-associated peptidase YedK [Planctomycetes bacterium Pan216]|uniref:Abasic site processing protein n=1 Tax=Kolteria novifilia TaxID=2527975 RepID=A0A518B1R7_9BACT|nr:Putative SOS response-associated peptidase YedK [Planctomycetes bacterium Pan216]